MLYHFETKCFGFWFFMRSFPTFWNIILFRSTLCTWIAIVPLWSFQIDFLDSSRRFSLQLLSVFCSILHPLNYDHNSGEILGTVIQITKKKQNWKSVIEKIVDRKISVILLFYTKIYQIPKKEHDHWLVILRKGSLWMAIIFQLERKLYQICESSSWRLEYKTLRSWFSYEYIAQLKKKKFKWHVANGPVHRFTIESLMIWAFLLYTNTEKWRLKTKMNTFDREKTLLTIKLQWNSEWHA